LQQQGFSAQAAELRRKNTNMILDSRSKQLVTSCPICYQSFKKEYNLPIKVVHHTEYIASLIKMGRIKLKHNDLRIAYHDSCELGRGCGIYEEPREVLRAVANLVPAARERKDSDCCGYNLGNTRLTLAQQMRLRDAAWENLTVNHPDMVATACPMCKKAFTLSSRNQVKDVAELVAAQLK
jgi:Fe-S oxidoreductase